MNMGVRHPADLQGQAADAEAESLASSELTRQDVEDIKWLMGHKPGRRLVWKLLSQAGVFRNPFNESSAWTAYSCGRQSVGQQMLGEVMAHTPAAFALMQQEQKVE